MASVPQWTPAQIVNTPVEILGICYVVTMRGDMRQTRINIGENACSDNQGVLK